MTLRTLTRGPASRIASLAKLPDRLNENGLREEVRIHDFRCLPVQPAYELTATSLIPQQF